MSCQYCGGGPDMCEDSDMKNPRKRQQEMNEMFERIKKIRAAIIDSGKRSGPIECPCCGANVNFGMASNGSIHAVCVGGCASWME